MNKEVFGMEPVMENKESEDHPYIEALRLVVRIPQEIVDRKDGRAVAEIVQEAIANGDEEVRGYIANIDLPPSLDKHLNWDGPHLRPVDSASEEADHESGEGEVTSADLHELAEFAGVRDGFEDEQQAREYFANNKFDDDSMASVPEGYDKLGL